VREEQHLSIGALSAATDCPVETIRYYERAGLLPAPARTEGGHRAYDDTHVQRLRFVRRARGLGFSLERVRRLLALADRVDCGGARDIAAAHLAELQATRSELDRASGQLEALMRDCSDRQDPSCAILAWLAGRATEAPATR
jgi:MerR family transcriptional regulator, mercuric resistance operon regulatory protein